jgi:hypothetical protein
MTQKEKYTTNQLAEERTLLAFIRTVAIFCGLYILLKKNVKIKNTYLILVFVSILLMYRLIFIDHPGHKLYIRLLGGFLIMCIILLIFFSN